MLSMTDRYVTQAAAAKHFGVDPSLITRKKKQGKLVMKGGLVDLERSGGAFSQVPASKRKIDTAPDGKDSGESFNDAQRRKESALADLRELEFKTKAGDLVSVTEMESAWAVIGQTMRDALLSMPERLAPRVAAVSDVRQCRDILSKEIRTVIGNIPVAIHDAAVNA
jgi:phage terminase Nu1 subunit (DNA packaging protein)